MRKDGTSDKSGIRPDSYLRLDEYELSLTMTVDVYQTNKKDTYLFLLSGAPFSSVPQSLRDSIELLQFLNTMEFAPEKSGAKQSEIHADIEKHGYSIHQARFKIVGHE